MPVSNARRRELYREWVSKGICGICACRPVVEGRTICQVCIDRKNNRNKKRRTRNVCIGCGERPIREGHSRLCEQCAEISKISKQRKRDKNKDIGLCLSCSSPVEKGYKHCRKCLDSCTALRNRRRAEGVCITCGDDVDGWSKLKGYSHCINCRDRSIRGHARRRHLICV